ncbi:BnaC04g05600D [Brassica napus]|uniref:BnaC04g05600D protein n=1 Tax=Brassica napus TaxID=3708 RepID=A0A078G536_BRANA|nr:BnaC04g05600D [Brassica napus]
MIAFILFNQRHLMFEMSLKIPNINVEKLRENIGKTKQHLDIMIWCIRHRFLEDVRSRYSDSTLWKALVLERKSNVIKRAWPEAVDQSSDCNVQDIAADLEVGYLQNDKRSFLRSRLEGNSGSYPFENLQTAADILFLHGSSDLVVAKQAIFMYYLFDRHWTTPEKYWKHILDDFATTFSITRHSLMESFVFAQDVESNKQAKCITVNAAYFLENLSSIYSWPFWSAFEWNLLVVCMGATLPLHPGIPS